MSELLRDPEFWVLVAFVIVIVGGFIKVGPSIGKALDDRAERIKAELDEAQRLREDAQKTLAEYQRKQRDALKEAEAIIAHAKSEAERIGQQAAQDLEAALERRTRQAEEKIAQEEAKALADVRNTAVDVAIAAARQIIAEQLDAKAGGVLIDQAIAALPQQLHKQNPSPLISFSLSPRPRVRASASPLPPARSGR
ncbi:MAG TPA: F0F1 ATP synthase subunit B [Stellaceae bacterium]|nr:F0F1 ATP synthase subunit B [Stellaceae bacterium]